MDLGKALMRAVADFNLDEVERLLAQGADVNWSRGEEEYYQPTTPLRMVCFRISDCMLEKEDLNKFGIIARMLMDAGAGLEEAMIVLRSRYGRFDLPWEREEEVYWWPHDIIAMRYCFPPETFRVCVKTMRLVGIRMGNPWTDIFETWVIPNMKRIQYECAVNVVEERFQELRRQREELDERIKQNREIEKEQEKKLKQVAAVAKSNKIRDKKPPVGELRSCSQCGNQRPQSAYKEDQWHLDAAARVCRSCIPKKTKEPVCSVCGSTDGLINDSPCVEDFGDVFLCAACFPDHRAEYEQCHHYW